MSYKIISKLPQQTEEESNEELGSIDITFMPNGEYWFICYLNKFGYRLLNFDGLQNIDYKWDALKYAKQYEVEINIEGRNRGCEKRYIHVGNGKFKIVSTD